MHDEQISPADELAVARRVVKQHQGYGCRYCTPTGCRNEDWAVQVVFKAVAASWPTGPKSLADVERIAGEIRGETE